MYRKRLMMHHKIATKYRALQRGRTATWLQRIVQRDLS